MNNMSNSYFTILETAEFFSVSTATIRNWIKMGYITLIEKGKVDKQSVFSFKTNKLGKDKLTGRANKSQKDSHDHDKLSKIIYYDLENNNLENIGSRYEDNLSDSYRNKEGIYYTPAEIVDDLFYIDEDIVDRTFLDPCCGSGNFIIKALELGFKPENIYGIDVDPIAVEITKKRIKEKTGYDSKNIFCADFLELYKENKLNSFDFIYTNPPWGKKIEKKEKELYANLLNCKTSNDSCSLFFFAALSLLNTNGKLGLLLPEAFFNVATFEQARKEVIKYKLCTLKDYGKAFKGLQTGAVGFVLHKKDINLNSKIHCDYRGKSFYRKGSSFLCNPKLIFNLNADEQEAEVIEYLLNIPHETLLNKAKWGLGIVTGNNAKFVKNKPDSNLIPVFKGSDITKKGLKQPTHFISNNFSQYQQVAPISLFEAKEKLIYKFISSSLCFHYDENQSYILNSANMLLVYDNFSVSMKVLSELFNSYFMNWLFSKIFNTHKVLRSDLESLPIYSEYIEDNSFDEGKYLSFLNIIKESDGTFRIKK